MTKEIMDKQKAQERVDALKLELSKLEEIINQPEIKLIWKETPEVYTPAQLIAGFEGCEIEFVKIEGGSFLMGSADDDSEAYSGEKPQHRVNLDGYYIGKFPVTQKQWTAVMGSNPSHFKGDNRPVDSVSWDDAQAFIKKLNAATGKTFALPTEAQWEYAARGGNQSKGYKYAGSNDINAVAWYDGNNNTETKPVGEKQANELGLYDMSGNVWEWCADWYDSNYYANSSASNPRGAASGTHRVLRGGSWFRNAGDCRVAHRNGNTPAYRRNRYGFRLVLIP